MKLICDSFEVIGDLKVYTKLLNKTNAVLGFKWSKNAIIELAFLGKKDMRELNKNFRGIDKETDVLSFGFEKEEIGFELCGQVAICGEVIEKQSLENGWSIQDEAYFLFVHGVLHISGLDHENKKEFKKMFGKHIEIMPGKQVERVVKRLHQMYWGDEF